MGPLDDQVVRADSLTATPDGLDIAVYSHWYRALPLPSLAKVDLTVDGERIDPAALAVTVNGHRYGFTELAEKGDEYWFTTDPVVLHVPVATSPGREHRVQLLLGLSIPYDRIVPVLIEGGFDGYLSSEYEGNRHIQDAYPVDSVEQVRRQHALFARLLGETTGSEA